VRQHVPQIRVGERRQHCAHASRPCLGHHREGLVDDLGLRCLGEQARQVAAHPLLGRQVDLAQGSLPALLDLLGRQRTGPPGVRRRQHQRPRQLRMALVQRQREPAAERQAEHMRAP